MTASHALTRAWVERTHLNIIALDHATKAQEYLDAARTHDPMSVTYARLLMLAKDHEHKCLVYSNQAYNVFRDAIENAGIEYARIQFKKVAEHRFDVVLPDGTRLTHYRTVN